RGQGGDGPAGGKVLCRGHHPNRENAPHGARSQSPIDSTEPGAAPAQPGADRLESAVAQRDPPAQIGGGIPQKERATLQPVAGAITADAGTIAAALPPAPVGPGGRAQDDQP